MKKILFVATVDSHIKNFHIPYLKYFKENGYEVHVATNGDEEIQYCDVKHIVSFERSPFKTENIKAYKELKKIILENKFEIIHCHTPVGGVIARMVAKRARENGTRVIYTAHGFHFYKGAPLLNWCIYYPVEKYLSKYTDTLITINEEDYKIAKGKFYTPNIELVNGVGVDKSKFTVNMKENEKEEYRKNLGLEKDDFVLIYVAELIKRKNQIMAIEMMKSLVAKKKNAKLLIVGNGILEEEYKQKIEEYGLKKNILMLGYRKDVPELMAVSNVSISVSKQEGLPVNIIEAMFIGLPVIATNCRGNRDLVPKENLVDIGDTAEMENKILHLKRQKVKYDAEKYELENIIKVMMKIYEIEE